ncbi:MAG: response regulator [Solirubrobacteraceae bacterium]|nr:response regulator [Solirubrobacteraceae bacterium]
MSDHLRVGVVEDSREDFLALKRILGPQIDVQRWQTGEQAIAALSGQDASELAVIFVDGNLPGMHGADLVSRIRESPNGQRARLAVFSGSTDPGAPARAMRAGADLFVAKGETLEQFKDAVAQCLGRAQPAG